MKMYIEGIQVIAQQAGAGSAAEVLKRAGAHDTATLTLEVLDFRGDEDYSEVVINFHGEISLSTLTASSAAVEKAIKEAIPTYGKAAFGGWDYRNEWDFFFTREEAAEYAEEICNLHYV